VNGLIILFVNPKFFKFLRRAYIVSNNKIPMREVTKMKVTCKVLLGTIVLSLIVFFFSSFVVSDAFARSKEATLEGMRIESIPNVIGDSLTVFLVSVNGAVSPQSPCGFNVWQDILNEVVTDVGNALHDSFTIDVRAIHDKPSSRILYREHVTMPCTIYVDVWHWSSGTDSLFVWVFEEITGDTATPAPLTVDLCVPSQNYSCIDIVAPCEWQKVPCGGEDSARQVPIWAHLRPSCQDTFTQVVFRYSVNTPGPPWYFIDDVIHMDDGYWKTKWNDSAFVEDDDTIYFIAIGYNQYYMSDTSIMVKVFVDCQALNTQLLIEDMVTSCFGIPKVTGLIDLKAVDDTIVDIHSMKFYYKLASDSDFVQFWHYIGEGEQLYENVYIYGNFNTASLTQNHYYDFRAIAQNPAGIIMFDSDGDGLFDNNTFIPALAQGSAKEVFIDNEAPQPAFSLVADSASSLFYINPSLVLGGSGKAYVKAGDYITMQISVLPSEDTCEVYRVEYYGKGYGDTAQFHILTSTYPYHFPINFEPISQGLIPLQQLEDGWWRGKIWALLYDSLGNSIADTINLFILDVLPFQAIIVDPLNDSYVSGDVSMSVATLNPYQISEVAYQQRHQDSTEWKDILNGTSTIPDSFPIIWHTVDMPPGVYFLRAVAKDSFGIPDPNPPIIKVGVYVCGDANGEGEITISDVVYLITYLYNNGSVPIPLVSGDVNYDEVVDLGDVVYLISYLYKGGPPPSC
jgi:hypothetical protein